MRQHCRKVLWRPLYLGIKRFLYGRDLVLRELTSTQSIGALGGTGFRVPPTLSMRGVAFENCHANSIGSVALIDCISDLQEVIITQSSSIHTEKSTVTITGSVIAICTETIEDGCMRTFASVVTMIESLLRGCTATRGGPSSQRANHATSCAISPSQIPLRRRGRAEPLCLRNLQTSTLTL